MSGESFPEDFSIIWDGQNYRPLGIRSHTREDGITVRLIDWQTDCPDCGIKFVISTGRTFRTPRRFCDNCKAPGKTARRVRKALMAVAAASIALVLALPALAHDGVNDGWYEDLMQPGQLHGFCCTKRDCKNVTARTVGNHFEVWIDSKTFPDLPNSPFEGHAPNAWVPVPEEAILHHHDNPTGEPVACWYQQQVRCFIEGTQV